ncbi:MAG TPA: antibiotic biosynthesis monooxygenase [Verrucomicrobiae bacterium]|jgi:heme-degrading monooxygenase HmoA
MNRIASKLTPPYYAVVFTSQRTPRDDAGYGAMAARMEDLARQQPGFLGVESARDADGVGITVSYWESLEAIRNWKAHAEHLAAQQQGKSKWYQEYRLRICRVEREYGFQRE